MRSLRSHQGKSSALQREPSSPSPVTSHIHYPQGRTMMLCATSSRDQFTVTHTLGYPKPRKHTVHYITTYNRIRMAVSQYPAEVWAMIFEYACTDDGRTGRSLALVSKMIKEYSKPWRTQCLAVHGPMQLLKLAALITENPNAISGGRVRNLHLCDNYGTGTHPNWEECAGERWGTRLVKRTEAVMARNQRLQEALQIRQGRVRDKRHPITELEPEPIEGLTEIKAEHLADAINVILTHTANHLESLTVSLSFVPKADSSSDEFGDKSRFPKLRELSLASPVAAVPSIIRFITNMSKCPSLRMVDVSDVQIQRVATLSTIATIAPYLTHLRIFDHLEALRYALGHSHRQDFVPKSLPDTLRVLIIARHHVAHRYHADNAQHARLKDIWLSQSQYLAASEPTRVIILRARKALSSHCSDIIGREVERNAGRLGHWNVPASERDERWRMYNLKRGQSTWKNPQLAKTIEPPVKRSSK